MSGDAGDDRLGQLHDLAEEGHQGVGVRWVAQVGAGAERGAGVGEDDRADVAVLGTFSERVGEFADQCGRQGVAVGRGVEGERFDSPRAGAADQGHAPSRRRRRSILPEAARGTPSMKVTWRTRL
ncbi:hypothetical protein SSP24_63260 [Streptomyces spinoverrucosus]|uniref:Uncharacterized protein n=1 Tax=Streptomyces spinoverrucosus TaxID=284043 RepID=A0A4Y3VSA3_9ACTN|nr:hypothetical protein SSP24_63260 [Streptomyces spinoverrucosus]GHB53748.1 hypothetical protein GCM10010397_24840 [Streptomyces spinoverrucosus]